MSGADWVVGIAVTGAPNSDRRSALAGKKGYCYVPPSPRLPGFSGDTNLDEGRRVSQLYVVSKNAQDPGSIRQRTVSGSVGQWRRR